MAYKNLFIQVETVQAAIAAMTELATLRRAQIIHSTGPNSVSEDAPALRQVRLLEWHAEQLSESARYTDSKPTEGEELTAIDNLLVKISKEAGYGYGTRERAKQLESYFESLRDQKSKAHATLAAFADDQRVKLMALQFMVEAALHGATHRMKDSRLYMVLDSINAIAQGLSGIDKDDVWEFGRHIGSTGSWDYRKLAAEVYRKNQRIQELEEKIRGASDVAGAEESE